MNATVATILALGLLSALFFLALCAATCGPTPLARYRRTNRKSTARFQERRQRFGLRQDPDPNGGDENENEDQDDVSGRMTCRFPGKI